MWKRIFAALLGAAAGSAPAQTVQMDQGFGLFGWKTLGLPAVADDNTDTTYASCPAPDDTQVVVGASSGGLRVSSLRLLKNGQLDMGYGPGGLVHLPLSINGTNPKNNAALCLGGGKVLVARRRAVVAGGDTNIQLLQIGADGQLDPNFGNGGLVEIDFDGLRAGLGDLESVWGLNRAANGEYLLSGSVRLAAGEERAAIARITPAGSVRDAAVLDVSGVDNAYGNSADYAPDGSLWLSANVHPAGAAVWPEALLKLDPATLALQSARIGSTDRGDLFPANGRMVRPGVLVEGGARIAPGDTAMLPVLFVHRADATSLLSLPAPAALGGRPAEVLNLGLSLTVLPGHRVLVANQVVQKRTDGDYDYTGFHFTLVHVGRTAAEDRVDTDFGNGGGFSVAYASPDASCAVVPTEQDYARISLWGGDPVFVGRAWNQCSPYRDPNWLVGRMKIDALFQDGFDD